MAFQLYAKNKKNVAIKLGDNHSNEINKLEGVSYYMDGSAILINNSKNEIVCEVIDVLHLEGIEEDYLVYFKVLRHKENDSKFLHMEEM